MPSYMTYRDLGFTFIGAAIMSFIVIPFTKTKTQATTITWTFKDGEKIESFHNPHFDVYRVRMFDKHNQIRMMMSETGLCYGYNDKSDRKVDKICEVDIK